MKLLSIILITLAGNFYGACAQQLSYGYDVAGNRTTRTIVVGTQGFSADRQQEVSQTYRDSLDGKELVIRIDNSNATLGLSAKEHDRSSKQEYSLLDEKGTLITKKKLSGKTTSVKLDDLPSGAYTLQIHINHRSSTWNLVKL
ncbi:hypothetical protein [Sphingobacterium haloxyli]|nr:hypothetical protein [Sphingobacterium haloxyli]